MAPLLTPAAPLVATAGVLMTAVPRSAETSCWIGVSPDPRRACGARIPGTKDSSAAAGPDQHSGDRSGNSCRQSRWRDRSAAGTRRVLAPALAGGDRRVD